MDHILIPVDFSEVSNNAMNYGLLLAKKTGAKVTLMHSIAYPVADPLGPVYQESSYPEGSKMEEIARGQMENLLTEVKNGNGKELQVDAITPMGFPGEEIIRESKDNQYDLLVMGTKGKEGMAKAILGSTTRKVVDEAQTHILVIPENLTPSPVKKIAYATDYHENDTKAIGQLKEWAKPFDASLEIVHIGTEDEEGSSSKETLKEALEATNNLASLPFHQIERQKDIVEDLEAYAHEGKVDMLAVLNRNMNIFGRIFDPSLSKKLVFHTDIPVLVFHYPKPQ